jgi:hypothetical protein
MDIGPQGIITTAMMMSEAHASDKTPAGRARQYRLPEDYVAAVLAEPLEADDEAATTNETQE